MMCGQSWAVTVEQGINPIFPATFFLRCTCFISLLTPSEVHYSLQQEYQTHFRFLIETINLTSLELVTRRKLDPGILLVSYLILVS